MTPLLIAILCLSTGFLCGVLCLPLITKGVGPNPTYGFRIKEAFQSDEAWFAINAYGGKWMLIWSLVIVALGLLFLVAHFVEEFALPQSLALFAAFSPCLLLISGIQTSLWAGKHFPVNGSGNA
ncbi:MAG: SdpI family protein [Verrucomicrobiota bacterium]